MTYFKFQPDIHGIYGIADYPSMPNNISFVAGQVIAHSLSEPLVFTVTNPPDCPPKHLLGSMIPVASRQFVEALRAAHVSNMQTFPAVLHNIETGQKWHDYLALNIVGLLDGADMRASVYDTIIGGDALPPLVSFSELVLARASVENHLVFRIVQSPSEMFMAGSVRDEQIARKPREGWGVTTTEVTLR